MPNKSNLVAIITFAIDPHAHFLQKNLDCPSIIIDHTEITKNATAFEYSLRDGQFRCKIDGKSVEPTSVWFRRPHKSDVKSLPIDKKYHTVSKPALDAFYSLIDNRFSDALWVSEPWAVRRAEDKLLQLEVAYRVGLHVPTTIITTSPARAKVFAGQAPTIAKTINGGWFEDEEGTVQAFFSSRVDGKTDFSGVYLAPPIMQRSIDVAADVRVTVVGNRVFAADIYSHDRPASGHVRDWRASDDDAVRYEICDLPQKIERQCVALVKELGLQFGAIDFVRDHKGKYWFLENNPSGQWAFVEVATGLPIAQALADLLTGRAEPL